MRLTREEIQEALRERHTNQMQDRLEQGKVAVAGLGGLGSNVAFSLARIGVGHLHLIDFDRVDISNLNRQQYLMRHIGMYKTEALKEELLEINPYLEIRTDCVRVTEDNLEELFREDEIVCEAFDVPDAGERDPGALPRENDRQRLWNGGLWEQQCHTDKENNKAFLSLRG